MKNSYQDSFVPHFILHTRKCVHLKPLVSMFLSLSASLLLCRTFAAHVIVQFALRLLEKELSSQSESDVSHALCGAFIFVCRQIYNTCEGLQVLRPYGLHKAVAAAWKKVAALIICQQDTETLFLFSWGQRFTYSVTSAQVLRV